MTELQYTLLILLEQDTNITSFIHTIMQYDRQRIIIHDIIHTIDEHHYLICILLQNHHCTDAYQWCFSQADYQHQKSQKNFVCIKWKKSTNICATIFQHFTCLFHGEILLCIICFLCCILYINQKCSLCECIYIKNQNIKTIAFLTYFSAFTSSSDMILILKTVCTNV